MLRSRSELTDCQDDGIFGAICTDDHYKYLIPLLIPTTSWFVIANWVGWEFFRNA